jgi:uncharacterized protein DUF4437
MSSDSFSGAHRQQSRTNDLQPMRVLAAILLTVLAAASAASAAPPAARVRTVLPMDNDAWRRGPPGFPGGSMFAVVSGDPAQAGPFTIRVELPSGYRLPAYFRPCDESIVVLAGAIEIGTRTLSAGSFIRLPANEWRSLSTHSGATLQIFGDGPFELSAEVPGT